MYNDGRAVQEALKINEVGNEIWEKLGYRMQPSWALPKLVWLLGSDNGLIRHARLVHQSDFINWRFVGHSVATDSSNALKTGYDLIDDRWPCEILERLHVPRELLPAVVRPGTALGGVCSRASAETGIPAGTRVVAGMTDGCAAQISAGALQPGNWTAVLGTTLTLKGVSAELIRDPNRVVYSHRSPDGGWLPGAASNAGAGILARYFAAKSLDHLSALAAGRELTDVVGYPLTTPGERFPFTAPAAEGFLRCDAADEINLFAGLVQNISFVERLCFDYLALMGLPLGTNLRVSGGTAENRYWRQLRADVLGCSVSLPEISQPAFGSALLAASSERPIGELVAELVHVRETIEPQSSRAVRLRELYARFVDELVARGWVDQRLAGYALNRVRGSGPDST
jgi:sugar (pentulose or hexulose) kinase